MALDLEIGINAIYLHVDAVCKLRLESRPDTIELWPAPVQISHRDTGAIESARFACELPPLRINPDTK